MEIECEDKPQEQLKICQSTNQIKYDEQIQRLEEKFSELSMERKKDIESYKIDLTKEIQALEKFRNTIKNTPSDKSDIAYTLEKKITDLNSIVTENYQEIKNKIEEAQLTANAFEGNLIGVTDEINTTLLPFVIGINRRTQAITNRLDAYWKNRGYNR